MENLGTLTETFDCTIYYLLYSMLCLVLKEKYSVLPFAAADLIYPFGGIMKDDKNLNVTS